jgi:hypothetical protein
MPANGAVSVVRSSPARVTLDLRLRTFDIGGERIAAGLAGACFGARILAALRTDKAAGRQAVGFASALRRALSAMMQASRRRSSLVASWRVASSRCAARSRLHSSSSGCPAFTRSPSFTHSLTICPPSHRRQFGAATGLDRTGARVDHCGFHHAGRDGGEFDLGRRQAG